MTSIKLILRLKESLLLLKYLIAHVISFFYRKREIWLLCERGREARDNAFFLFLWLKKFHPEKEVYYIIDKAHPDYEKLKAYNKSLIQYKSAKHYLMACRATYLISTHIMGYTDNPYFFAKVDKKIMLFPRAKRVFLQHGIIKNLLRGLFADNVRLNLFVCGGKIEHEYVLSKFGYTPDVAQYTGLCRYDNLLDFRTQKQVLIMPTWRMYIDKNRFEESDYYKNYKDLLTSDRLVEILERYGYTAVFYPHFEVQSKIHLFKNLIKSDRLTISGFEKDVQTLLKESDCMITDYSSVCFDMSYMMKPVLFYQFDKVFFFQNHYIPGDYDESAIGCTCFDVDSLLNKLEQTLAQDCRMESKYADFSNKMFLHRDTSNCERVYNSIISVK